MSPRFTQESDFRQPRDFGQKFSATFEFIGAHWRGLGRALLYIVLPAALLQGLITGLVQQQFLQAGLSGAKSGHRPSALDQLALFGSLSQSPYYWVSIALSAVFIALLVLTVYGYVACCLRPAPSNEPIAPSAVWAVVRQHLVSSIFSYFGLIILVLLGFALLFVPGLYLSVALSLFFVVKVMEDSGFTATVRRCLGLTRGKWWSTFGLLLVMSLMLGVVLTVVGSVVGGLAFALGRSLFRAEDLSSSMGIFTVVVTTVGGLLNLLIYPPVLLAVGFQYFNLVERRDGLGLRQMVSQLGQAPVPVGNAAYRPDEEGEY